MFNGYVKLPEGNDNKIGISMSNHPMPLFAESEPHLKTKRRKNPKTCAAHRQQKKVFKLNIKYHEYSI